GPTGVSRAPAPSRGPRPADRAASLSGAARSRARRSRRPRRRRRTDRSFGGPVGPGPEWRRYAESRAQLDETPRVDRIDHDAAFVGAALGLGLRLAMDQDATRRTRHGRRGHELIEVALQSGLEGLAGADGCRIHDDERLAEIGRRLGAEEADDVRAEHRPAEHARQDVDREREPVALVAA